MRVRECHRLIIFSFLAFILLQSCQNIKLRNIPSRLVYRNNLSIKYDRQLNDSLNAALGDNVMINFCNIHFANSEKLIQYWPVCDHCNKDNFAIVKKNKSLIIINRDNYKEEINNWLKENEVNLHKAKRLLNKIDKIVDNNSKETYDVY